MKFLIGVPCCQVLRSKHGLREKWPNDSHQFMPVISVFPYHFWVKSNAESLYEIPQSNCELSENYSNKMPILLASVNKIFPATVYVFLPI